MEPYYYSIRPEALEGTELDRFLAMGWYRMHQGIFTSSHLELDQPYRVHWLRYALKELDDRGSHKRIRNRNKSFHYTIEDFNGIREDQRELHRRYRASIDFDGAITIEDCLFGSQETRQNIYNTKVISVFDGDRLIAGGYFDVGATAAASILHFFDPRHYRYSLGKYLILLTVDYLIGHGYEYYYPGYVVEGLDKMNYKLFLGREIAQYFDPESIVWNKFHERILIKQHPQQEDDDKS